MEGFNIILNQIAVLSLAMAIGFVSVKSGYISEDVKNALSKVIVKITLPLVVVMSLTKVDLNAEKAANCLIVAALAIVSVGILYFSGGITAGLFRMPRKRAIVHQCMSAFGNVVFLGYPLIEALFGAEGLLYAAIYGIANDAFVWTLGVYKLSSADIKNQKSSGNWKNLINPVTISFVVAIVMMITGIKITGIFGTVFTSMGGTTTWLSMLFIGGTLALVDFKHIYKHWALFIMSAVKMVIMPVILIFLLRLLPIDPIVCSVVILQAAMPCQTVLTIITTEYNGDVVYAAEGVFVTTIIGLFTLPLVYWIMNI